MACESGGKDEPISSSRSIEGVTEYWGVDNPERIIDGLNVFAGLPEDTFCLPSVRYVTPENDYSAVRSHDGQQTISPYFYNQDNVRIHLEYNAQYISEYRDELIDQVVDYLELQNLELDIHYFLYIGAEPGGGAVFLNIELLDDSIDYHDTCRDNFGFAE